MSSNESFFVGRKKVLESVGWVMPLWPSLKLFCLPLKGETAQRTNNAQATSKSVKKQDLTPRLSKTGKFVNNPGPEETWIININHSIYLTAIPRRSIEALPIQPSLGEEYE